MRRTNAALLGALLIGGNLMNTTAAVATHCSGRVGIKANSSSNSYQNWGMISCGTGTRTRELSCKTVHRHTMSWHSHPVTIAGAVREDEYRYSKTIYGTNGDTYKTSCRAYYDGSLQWTAESPAVNL